MVLRINIVCFGANGCLRREAALARLRLDQLSAACCVALADWLKVSAVRAPTCSRLTTPPSSGTHTDTTFLGHRP